MERSSKIDNFGSIEGNSRHDRRSHDVLRHTGSERTSVCPVDDPNFWLSQAFIELCIA